MKYPLKRWMFPQYHAWLSRVFHKLSILWRSTSLYFLFQSSKEKAVMPQYLKVYGLCYSWYWDRHGFYMVKENTNYLNVSSHIEWYRMNVIDFLKILYHFPAVPSFHFLTPFSVTVHGSRGTQKLVQYFQQLYMETMEHFVIVNNEYY